MWGKEADFQLQTQVLSSHTRVSVYRPSFFSNMTAVLPYGDRFGVWGDSSSRLNKFSFSAHPPTPGKDFPHGMDNCCYFCSTPRRFKKTRSPKGLSILLEPCSKDVKRKGMDYMHTSKWARAVETSLVVPQKFKLRITMWLSTFTPRYMPTRIENRYSNACTCS